MVSFTRGWAGNLCADHHRNLQIHRLVKPFLCCICELASENANEGWGRGLLETFPFSLFLPMLISILSHLSSFVTSNSGSLLSNLFCQVAPGFWELLQSLLSAQEEAFLWTSFEPQRRFGLSGIHSDLLGSDVFPSTLKSAGPTSSSPAWWGYSLSHS